MGGQEEGDAENGDRAKLIGDAAKLSIDHDEFGLKNMVAAIAKGIAYYTPDDGYILGLEGRWGSGKSSFANFLIEEIKKRAPDHKIIRFDPWLIGDKNALIAFYFGQFATRLDEVRDRSSSWAQRRALSRLANRVRKYGRYAGSLAAPLSGLGLSDPTGALAATFAGIRILTAVSKLWRKPSLEQLRGQIIAELGKLRSTGKNIRFVVVIDNLDRLEPLEVAEILRLVRAVADFPLTTYVACFDREVLSRQVKIALRVADGHEFIEKIFTNIIAIPPYEPFALRRYLRKLLQDAFPNEMARASSEDMDLEYRRELLFDKWAGKLISTPRDVMRLIDACRLSWPDISKDADFFDCVWLQLVKLKAPKLYNWTREYLANVASLSDGGRPGEGTSRRDAISLHRIMSEYEWQRGNHESGLSAFLPGVKSFVLDGDKRQVYELDSNELEANNRHKRLGSPIYWRQYFAFDLPSYAIRDAELAAFRLNLVRSPKKAAAKLIELAKRPHDRPGHYVDLFLDRLQGEHRTFSAEEARGLVLAFSDVMDDIVGAVGEIRRSGQSELWRKAARLLVPAGADQFIDLIPTGKSLNWFARVIRDQGFAHAQSSARGADPTSQWLDRHKLERAVALYMRRLQKESGETIFSKPSPLEILFCWLQLGDPQQVRRFFAKETEKDGGLLRALNALRGWESSSTRGIRHPIRRKYVEYFMDADKTKRRLEEISAQAREKKLRGEARVLLNDWDDEEGESRRQTESLLAQPTNFDSLLEYSRWKFPQLEPSEKLTTALIGDLNLKRYPSLAEIDAAVTAARRAVEAYRAENPNVFKWGTDFVTKSLGFVDLEFRKRHGFAENTRAAFERHAKLVQKPPQRSA